MPKKPGISVADTFGKGFGIDVPNGVGGAGKGKKTDSGNAEKRDTAKIHCTDL